METNVISMKNRSNSALKGKNIVKSPLRYKNCEEILKLRMHTIPQPFVLHSSKEKKICESQNVLKSFFDHILPSESQRSTGFALLSPRKPYQKTSRLVKSALKSRPTTSSPIKKVQFQEFFNKNCSISKQKQ